jgi:hypothetical protein
MATPRKGRQEETKDRRETMTMTEKLEVGLFGAILTMGLPALMIGAQILAG